MPSGKLIKTIVDGAAPARREDGTDAEQTYWDSVVRGFGLRVSPNGAKAYVLVYRLGGGRRGRLRRYTIGRPGSPWTVEGARDEARKILGDVVRGRDPAGEKQAARKAETVSELCDAYLKAVETGEVLTRSGRPKRASTQGTDKGRIERHIKPLLGHLRVVDVTSQDVRRFVAGVTRGDTAGNFKTKRRGRAIVKGGAGTAARTVGLLSGIFAYAVAERMRTENPVHGVERAKDGRRDRILSPDEWKALGKAIREAEKTGTNKWGIAATKLLALTGARRGEILSLRRDAVDAGRQAVTLEESKTGRSVRPVGKTALDVIRDTPAIESNPYILPAGKGEGGHYLGLPKLFRDLVDAAELTGVTPHTLRHSFASVANDLGYAEPTIAAMLGHARHTTTSRYVHVIDSALVAAADKVSLAIGRMMGIAEGGEVVEMPRRRRPSRR